MQGTGTQLVRQIFINDGNIKAKKKKINISVFGQVFLLSFTCSFEPVSRHVTAKQEINFSNNLLGQKDSITLLPVLDAWGILLKACMPTNLTDQVIFLKVIHFHNISWIYTYILIILVDLLDMILDLLMNLTSLRVCQICDQGIMCFTYYSLF